MVKGTMNNNLTPEEEAFNRWIHSIYILGVNEPEMEEEEKIVPISPGIKIEKPKDDTDLPLYDTRIPG